MGIGAGVWLFVLGVLGAANLIIAKKPDAKELIGKISPYQGWIGFVSMWWGLWGIISSVLYIGTWLKHYPVWWITYLAAAVIQILLGSLLGVGTFKSFVKQEDAVKKVDQLVEKMSPYQGTLGLIAMGLGLWTIVASFLFMG